MYNFEELPYAYDAIEPVIDEQTMHLHKDRHHKTYFEKFVAAIKETDSNGQSLKEIFAKVSKFSSIVRDNGGGYYNHDLYFNAMRTPRENNQPTGELAQIIDATFGSFTALQEKLTSAAMSQFGSGWGWLIVKNGQLIITQTPNQDNPLMDVAAVQGTPILGCDVWEHSYYLTYQNNRLAYITNWWKVVNWDYVTQRYQAAINQTN